MMEFFIPINAGGVQDFSSILLFEMESTSSKEMSNERRCGVNILIFLQSLHALAASIHYSMLEIGCLEEIGRPGRRRKGELQNFRIDAKIRRQQLKRLKKEVTGESAQMTSMMNLLFRPDRPIDCYCGECPSRLGSEKRKLEVLDQPGPSKRKTGGTMVWIDDAPKFISTSNIVLPNTSINNDPLDLSLKSSNLGENLQPKVYLKDIRSLLENPSSKSPDFIPHVSSQDEAGPSWYIKPECVKVVLEEDPLKLKLCACGTCV